MTDTRSGATLPTKARWSVIEPLLDEALALSPDERSAFLDRACGADVALRGEAGRLLAECERLYETRELDQPAAVRFVSLWDERPDVEGVRAAIAGRYRLEREIAQGGMAIVYLARALEDDREVALKMLRATTSPSGAARFRREMTIASQLRHERILPLLDSGESDERLWYTMPYVSGGSLGARLSGGRLPLSETVRILREICEGLVFAHAQGIVHRDLKPDNVLLSDGHAVIADFGVAKALYVAAHGDTLTATAKDIRTVTGVGVGTAAYMSPEQCAGERSIDHRADLYTLGVMAYELLAGVRPFTGATRQALVTAHLAVRPTPLSKHRRDLPAPLETVVMRLLEKLASDRPTSASEVIAVLDRVTAVSR